LEALVNAMDLGVSGAWSDLRRELERSGLVEPRLEDIASAGRGASPRRRATREHAVGAYAVVPATGTSRLHVVIEHHAMCELVLDRLLLQPRFPGLRIDRVFIGYDKQIGGTCVPIETLDIDRRSYGAPPNEPVFRVLWLDHARGPNEGQRRLNLGESVWVELTSLTAIDVPVYFIAPFWRPTP